MNTSWKYNITTPELTWGLVAVMMKMMGVEVEVAKKKVPLEDCLPLTEQCTGNVMPWIHLLLFNPHQPVHNPCSSGRNCKREQNETSPKQFVLYNQFHWFQTQQWQMWSGGSAPDSRIQSRFWLCLESITCWTTIYSPLPRTLILNKWDCLATMQTLFSWQCRMD